MEILKKGKTKSKALNNAKRKYINTHSLSEISSYHCSSFILIGDTGVVELRSYTYLYISFGIAIILIIIFFFRKKINFLGNFFKLM